VILSGLSESITEECLKIATFDKHLNQYDARKEAMLQFCYLKAVSRHGSGNGTVEGEYLRRKGAVELRYLRTAIKKLTCISTLH